MRPASNSLSGACEALGIRTGEASPEIPPRMTIGVTTRIFSAFVETTASTFGSAAVPRSMIDGAAPFSS